jgi:hypothetical protein
LEQRITALLAEPQMRASNLSASDFVITHRSSGRDVDAAPATSSRELEGLRRRVTVTVDYEPVPAVRSGGDDGGQESPWPFAGMPDEEDLSVVSDPNRTDDVLRIGGEELTVDMRFWKGLKDPLSADQIRGVGGLREPEIVVVDPDRYTAHEPGVEESPDTSGQTGQFSPESPQSSHPGLRP